MTYRILSLDGGGIWALVQIKALISLYNDDESTSGHTVLKDFDLVAANSAGSIVLGGLIENLSLGGIRTLFEEISTRKSIFSLAGLSDVALHDLAENLAAFVAKDSNLNLTGVVPKYSERSKLSALQRMFPTKGSISLTKVAAGVHRRGAKEDVHLLIAGFDYDLNRAVFFRSSEVSGPQWGTGEATDVTLCEAIHASTNAPVKYYDAPAQFPNGQGRRYWDGAIAGYNNPVLAAVTEAIGIGQDPANIAALSIGTASVVLPRQNGQHSSPYAQPILGPGIVHDLRKLATSIIDDPPDVATFLAHVMTGGKGAKRSAKSRVVRLNPLICPVKKRKGWSAPGSMTRAEFTCLANLDLDAIEQWQVKAITKYADLWIKNVALNQPIRMNGKTFKPELGQDRFKDAVAAWNSIKRAD